MALQSCTVVFLLWLGCTAHEGTACEDPPDIDFGEIISGNKSRYMERDRVQYMCNAGYTLSGSEWVTCLEKIWVPGPPQCLAPCIITKQQLEVKNLLLSNGQRHSFLIQSERPCGSIPKVANAQIEGRNKESYEPGETIRYECDEGFLIVGTPEIICREGNWTAPPFCEDVTCGAAPEIPNAYIASTQREGYLPGARVQYECESNFQMMDINYVTCTNGQWSQAPTCRDVTCEPPPEIAGGKIEGVKKSRYLPGESARYQCWRGFQMTGSSSVTCQTGNWTELPKCKGEGGKCGPPPVIENGDLLSFPMQEYSQGNCTLNKNTMEGNHIQLRSSNLSSKSTYRSGDYIDFECKWWYQKVSRTESFRAECLDGMIQYPTCEYTFG
ncbi:complement factor H [Patagioenas fasciata monilis]|uniref:Complement factor H n=1 Tax=Patagioenas fasciata monilis TaxID=372326 RepID=A0A1V4JYA7_PATFA|nr:complement factor H [Patagioenas fasciata monilis]